MALKSTTAPGKTFASRSEIADHYKSDWHKYNLKRREAGLPLLEEKEFRMRLEAALALRKEKEKKNGTDHIKNINSKKNINKNKNKAKDKKKEKNKDNKEKYKNDAGKLSSEVADGDTEMVATSEEPSSSDDPKSSSRIPAALAESQENPDIDPKQSLFDQHISRTLKENVHYMQQKYGFFLPDQECLVDHEGLLGYCHEKIKMGHFCLYCEQ